MPEKTTLKIGHLPITDHLILGVTADKLSSGKETFQYAEVDAKAYRGWNPLAEDLRKGELDAACILAPLAMELYQSGVPVNLVLQTHKSGSTLIKNKKANIEKIEDFKGKAILIPHYLSIHHLLFDRHMREQGLEVGAGKDIIFDVCAPSDIPEILEWDDKGLVGGFIVAEPFGMQVVKAGLGEEMAMSKELWPDHPCCVLVVREEVIGKNPDAVQELTNSLVASGKFISQNVDEAARIGSTFLNQAEDVVKSVLADPKQRVTMNELFPVVDDYEYIQEYMTTKIEAMSKKIELEKFVDTRFAKEAGAT
ncbi:MAG: twin-arginine translocation pathway signal protein [Anaerolineaceae bacterium]|nr:twin-arginine translocation pathway signal protein [Anaerolineaceae bacterium]